MGGKTGCTIIWTSLLLFAALQMSVGGEDDDPQMSNESKLKKKLQENYDASSRPVIHHTNTTQVAVSLVPLRLIYIDEDQSMMIMDAPFILNWVDDRLSWKPEDYAQLKNIHLPDHTVWQPDITVYNSHSWNIDPRGWTHVDIDYSGDVWTNPPAFLTTYCSLTPVSGSYPRETVECKVVIGSWSHDGWQIDLGIYHDGLFMDEFMNTNPRWEMLVDQATIIRNIAHYNCCEEPYITVVAKFPFKRRYPPELQVVFSPCILVMTLTLTMFWIPSDSGKKFILGSFSFLALTGLMTYVALATRSATAAKKAVSFLSSTMYAVVSAMVLEVLVINLANFVGPNRPPEVLVNILSGPVGKIAGVFARWTNNVPGDKIQLKEESDQVTNQPTPKDEWLLVATALDRILFVLFIIVFAAIHRV